jgi:hypothetical protein
MSEPHHSRTVTARWWRSFMRMIVDGNEGIADLRLACADRVFRESPE